MLNGVEDQMHSYHDATKPLSKARSLPPNKWKTRKLLEVAVDRLNDVLGSKLISLRNIRKDLQ
jgi:hypothetical protein